MPSPKKEKKEIFPSSSYRASIILTLNHTKTVQENYKPVTPMNINTKILNIAK